MNNKNDNTSNSAVHLMTLDNTPTNRLMVQDMRRKMVESKSPLQIRLRGRGHRFGKANYKKCNSYQAFIPLTVAKKFAIYLVTRTQRRRSYPWQMS